MKYWLLATMPLRFVIAIAAIIGSIPFALVIGGTFAIFHPKEVSDIFDLYSNMIHELHEWVKQ